MNSVWNYRLFYAVLHCILVLNVCFGKDQDRFHIRPQCGAGTNAKPLDISMSPGFLTGALPYVGHHDCTDDGVCRNIPFICPESSCCISKKNNITQCPITSKIASHCGCWDSKRKSCEPMQSFRLGSSTTCSEDGGIWVRSQFELAQTSTVICKKNTATTEINLSNDGNEVRIGITITACSPRNIRNGRIVFFLGGAGNLVHTLEHEIGVVDVEKKSLLTLIKKSSVQPSLSPSNAQNFTKHQLNVSNNYENHQLQEHYKKLALERCSSDVGSATISMCPGLLPETLNAVLNPVAGVCGNQGTYRNSNKSCSTTSCCLIAHNRDFYGCDCVPTNQEDCLLDHKVFRINGVTCTSNGERVQRELSIRIPSTVSNNCISNNSSWPITSFKYKLHGSDNLLLTIEKRHCVVINSFKQEYLEVEEIIRAEINKDKLRNTLEKISE